MFQHSAQKCDIRKGCEIPGILTEIPGKSLDPFPEKLCKHFLPELTAAVTRRGAYLIKLKPSHLSYHHTNTLPRLAQPAAGLPLKLHILQQGSVVCVSAN